MFLAPQMAIESVVKSLHARLIEVGTKLVNGERVNLADKSCRGRGT